MLVDHSADAAPLLVTTGGNNACASLPAHNTHRVLWPYEARKQGSFSLVMDTIAAHVLPPSWAWRAPQWAPALVAPARPLHV